MLLDRYVESRLAFEFGTVCHAFAAALRVVIDDWKLMVAQLEHQMLAGKGTLQALWFYCQPALVVLELAASALLLLTMPVTLHSAYGAFCLQTRTFADLTST